MSAQFTSQEWRQLDPVLDLPKMAAHSPDSSQILLSLSPQQEADAVSVPTNADAAKPSCLDTDSHMRNGLPSPSPLASPAFSWGEYEASTFAQMLEEAYDEVVHWRRNLFQTIWKCMEKLCPRSQQALQGIC